MFPFPLAFWKESGCLLNNWQDVVNEPGNADLGSGQNLTIVVQLTVAAMSNTGLCALRATFAASSTEAFQVTKCYVGPRNMAGDAYDFETTPTQLFFDGGNAGFSIAANQTKVSDVLELTIDGAKDFLIAFHIANSAANDGYRRDTSAAWNWHFKAGGDDSATVNKTGYTTVSGDTAGVLRVEATP